MPGILQSFNAEKMTATVQPAIQAQSQDQSGKWSDVNLPVLTDCPVLFPGGGGYLMTFPLVEGDEVLLVFASRCIDSWWQNGGVQPQADLRMHDLSDGFCLPGLHSQARLPQDVSPTSFRIQSTDGAKFLEFTEDGDLLCSGRIVAKSGTPQEISLTEHVHGGVQTGGGISGPPQEAP